MSATIFTAEEAKKAQIELITDPAKGCQAVHDAVVALRANRRRGTASTKTKAEVNLSGAKPWRQKGTGRARAGDKASPIWVGGGVVFGPRPRSYAKHTPKKVKVLAFRKALVVGVTFDESTYLAGRNVQKTLLVRAADVNTEQLLAFDKIILTQDAL